ncbi:MAG: cytochrome c [Bacteroidetes bacterium]|nr:cytochrome c [Bacteroidota bacterium]
MKKTSTILALVACAAFMANCSSSKKSASTEMSEAAKVAEVNKNFTPTQMLEGKTLWENHCGKCHKLYEPGSHSVAKWERVLPRMITRSKLTNEQGQLIRAFLLSKAKVS